MDYWIKFCSIPKKKKNSLFSRIIERSHYKFLFVDDSTIGLSTSNLPSDLLMKLTTEKDLEHISQVKEKSSIVCNIYKVEVNLLLPQLVKTTKLFANYPIQVSKYKFSHREHESLNITTKKMIMVRPTDPPNTICVITGQKQKGLLGTNYGIFTGWLNSECLNKSTKQLIHY